MRSSAGSSTPTPRSTISGVRTSCTGPTTPTPGASDPFAGRQLRQLLRVERLERGTGVGATEQVRERGLLARSRRDDRRTLRREHRLLDRPQRRRAAPSRSTPASSSVRASSSSSGWTAKAMPYSTACDGIEPRAGEEHVRGALPAHAGGKEVAARGLGWHPHLGERGAEPGALGHQDQIAVREDREADADRESVHRRDAAACRTSAPPRAAPGTRSRSISPDASFAISFRSWPAENARPAPVMHDHVHGVVGPGVVEGGGEAPVQRRVERVERLGSIEREQPHRAGVGGLDHGVPT